jgi:phosphinothricin acetyltransferase
MTTLQFEALGPQHAQEVMDIFNHYIENSFSAYPEKRLPVEFFGKFLEMTKNYPAYALRAENDLILGFCFLRAYNPFPAFRQAAEITYFIKKDHTGQGLGLQALTRLEQDAKTLGITHLLASITSENQPSLAFHQKYGFVECGRFRQIAQKFGKKFDIVWMQKTL